MDGLGHVWTVTADASAKGVEHARIDETFLKAHVKDFSGQFYLCGPDPMVAELRETLAGLGAMADALTWEK